MTIQTICQPSVAAANAQIAETPKTNKRTRSAGHAIPTPVATLRKEVSKESFMNTPLSVSIDDQLAFLTDCCLGPAGMQDLPTALADASAVQPDFNMAVQPDFAGMSARVIELEARNTEHEARNAEREARIAELESELAQNHMTKLTRCIEELTNAREADAGATTLNYRMQLKCNAQFVLDQFMAEYERVEELVRVEITEIKKLELAEAKRVAADELKFNNLVARFPRLSWRLREYVKADGLLPSLKVGHADSNTSWHILCSSASFDSAVDGGDSVALSTLMYVIDLVGIIKAYKAQTSTIKKVTRTKISEAYRVSWDLIHWHGRLFIDLLDQLGYAFIIAIANQLLFFKQLKKPVKMKGVMVSFTPERALLKELVPDMLKLKDAKSSTRIFGFSAYDQVFFDLVKAVETSNSELAQSATNRLEEFLSSNVQRELLQARADREQAQQQAKETALLSEQDVVTNCDSTRSNSPVSDGDEDVRPRKNLRTGSSYQM
ncbi:hypothetical protein HDU89_001151 [Geranomyces variabilis]|nr:hypothetical protein HDU89_001151 [Geranomyces variabilis]